MQPGSSIHQAISAGSDSLPFPIHFSWQMIIADSVTHSADWVMRCWRGYLSGTRCKWFVCGPTDATATRSSLAALKSRLVQPSWCRLTQVVLDMRPLNRCLSVCMSVMYSNPATWSLTLPQTVDRSSLMHCSLWWKQSQLMRIHQMIAAETKLQSVILCCGENHTFDLAVNWSHGNRVPVSQLSAQWLLCILMTTLIITTTTITTRLILSVVV